MNILLTGANGFLGSSILKMLVANHDVSITLRKHSNLNRIKEVLDIYTVEKLFVDTDNIDFFFKNKKIDLIVHCATDYGRQDETFDKVHESNLLFPLKLLETGLKYDLKWFLNTDSYFNKNNLTYNALPHYSKTKKIFAGYLKDMGKKIVTINMRLEHIYGSNDGENKFIPWLLDKLVNNDDVDLTSGDQKRDFIYIDDVTDAYQKVISSLDKSYNPGFKDLEIGSGSSIKLKIFIETIRDALDSKSLLNFGSLDYRDDEIMNSVANSSLEKFGRLHDLIFSFRSIDVGAQILAQNYSAKLEKKR